MTLLDFRPRLLEAALEKVRVAHPHRGNGTELSPTNDLVAQVRARLAAASENQLLELAAALRPEELKAALYLVAFDEEPEIFRRAKSVVRHRCRPDILRYGWGLLKDSYPGRHLEDVVREVGQRVSWRGVAPGPAEQETIRAWFAAESLPQGLLEGFRRSNSPTLRSWLESHRLPDSSGLGGATWQNALVRGSASLIDRIGHRVLLERAQRSRDAHQRAFGRNYLISFRGSEDRWAEPVVTWIRERYGLPDRVEAALTSFWRPIPEEVRQRFRRLIVGQTLKSFFESIKDPHGRLEFWKGFLDRIEDAEAFLAGSVVMIDFGSFGVVEFAEKGNAAYVYPRRYLSSLRERARARSTSVWQFKDRSETIATPGWDGRIIHRQDWQYSYRRQIQRLVDRY